MIAKCEHCQFVHKFNDTSSIGKTAKCKQCGRPFVVKDCDLSPPIEPTNQQNIGNETTSNDQLIAAINALQKEVVGLRTDFNSFSERLPKPIDESGILTSLKIMLLICGLLVVVVSIVNGSTEFFDRFKDDNAVGATANALERIIKQIASIQSMLCVVAFMLFFVAVRFPWAIQKPAKTWIPPKQISKTD